MTASGETVADFHWLLEVLQTIDVGVLVVDRRFAIQSWNAFMENHSGIAPNRAIGRNLFDVFPDLPRDWFEHKSRTVIQLKNRAFTTWEQRPYVFRFKNNRPITGTSEFMYQNCTFIPVTNTRGEVDSLCVIVYDVTDVAVSKLELQRANGQLQEMSRVDGLTGLFNRTFWEEQLALEFRRQKRAGQPTSMVMFDIDRFKRFNDDHGHLAGDEVLRQVAAVVRRTVRASDIAGRYGGEEFALILPDTSASDAVRLSERLRERIARHVVKSGGQSMQVTVSLGVAGWNSRFEIYNDWIVEADRALYQSKENGRDRVTLA